MTIFTTIASTTTTTTTTATTFGLSMAYKKNNQLSI